MADDDKWLARDLWDIVDSYSDKRVSVVHLPGLFDSRGVYCYPHPWEPFLVTVSTSRRRGKTWALNHALALCRLLGWERGETIESVPSYTRMTPSVFRLRYPQYEVIHRYTDGTFVCIWR